MAAKPAKAKPVQTGGARHPARPGTQTAAQRAAKSPDAPDGLPPFAEPQQAAPEPGPRPTVTAPIPDHTRPRTHAERNA